MKPSEIDRWQGVGDPLRVRQRPEGATSLDLSTQLGDLSVGDKQCAGWKFTYWPECAEASLSWVWPYRSIGLSGVVDRLRAERRAEELELLARVYGPDKLAKFASLAADMKAEQAAMNWQQANGRAGSKSRRYFVSNRLRYMWVLTFAGEHWDRRSVMREVSEFARRLRVSLGGSSLAYWYSPELHPGGHGWHVNFFVPRRIEHALMQPLWGFGFVWVTDFATSPHGPKGEPLGLCANPRESWRRAARYGCKYAQKDWSPEHVGRANHRYEIAQGFAPTKQSQWVTGSFEAEQLVAELLPSDDYTQLSVWDSNDSPDWERPPARTWRW